MPPLSSLTHALTIERTLKGVSNRWRLRFLDRLDSDPYLSESELASLFHIHYKTSFDHFRRLTAAGLVRKERHGFRMMHPLTPLGRSVLVFVRKLDKFWQG